MSNSSVPVKWAQRKDKIFLTLEVVDATQLRVAFDETKVAVEGTGVKVGGGSKVTEPFCTMINLHKEIDPSQSRYKASGNVVQVLCMKKDQKTSYWDRLTQEPTKQVKTWLAVDWSLYKDEDEEVEGEKVNFGGYGDVSNMLNMGAEGGRDSDDEDGPEPANLDDLDE